MNKLNNIHIASFLILLSFTFSLKPLQAEMAPGIASGRNETRETELVKIKLALESRMVRQKLMENGLSPEEVSEKLAGMSDDQIHLLASASDDVLAGGDGGGFGFIFTIIIIVLLIIIIIKLSGKDIKIKVS